MPSFLRDTGFRAFLIGFAVAALPMLVTTGAFA